MLPGKEKTQYGFHLLGFCSGGVLLIDSQNSLCSLATLASLTVYPPAFLHGVFTRSRSLTHYPRRFDHLSRRELMVES